jgi:hypothetical protein
MANPYLDSNPYIVRKAPNTVGPLLKNLALELYAVRDKSGTKTTQTRIGKTNPGEAQAIPNTTVETPANLNAFDFGKGGEQAPSPSLFTEGGENQFVVDQSLAPEGMEAAAETGSLVEPFAADSSLATIGDYGALTEAELASYAAEEAAMTEAGVTAGETGSAAGSSAGGVSAGAVLAIMKAAFMNKDKAANNQKYNVNNNSEFQKYYNESSQHPVAGALSPWQPAIDMGYLGKDTAVGRVLNAPAKFEEWGVGKIRKLTGCIIISACTSKDITRFASSWCRSSRSIRYSGRSSSGSLSTGWWTSGNGGWILNRICSL